MCQGRDPFANLMVTQFFCLLRRDSPPPPRPSLKVSPSELTAGAPELDTLLSVHLQVCKALLQVSGWGLARVGTGLKVSEYPGPESHGGSVAGGEEPHESQRAKP